MEFKWRNRWICTPVQVSKKPWPNGIYVGFSKDHFGWRGREWLSEVGKKRLLQCSRLWRRTPDQDRDQGAGAEGTKSESKGPALD